MVAAVTPFPCNPTSQEVTWMSAQPVARLDLYTEVRTEPYNRALDLLRQVRDEAEREGRTELAADVQSVLVDLTGSAA